MIETFAGVEFRVSSVSNVVDDCESIEFVAEDGPNVAVSTRDDDPSKALYISVDGEVQEAVLLQTIDFSRTRLGAAR